MKIFKSAMGGRQAGYIAQRLPVSGNLDSGPVKQQALMDRRVIVLWDKVTDCSHIAQAQSGNSSQILNVGCVAERPIPPGCDP